MKKNEIGRACSTYDGEERCIQGYGRKSEGSRSLGRQVHEREYNIKKDLQKVRWGMDWIDLAQNRNRWWVFGMG